MAEIEARSGARIVDPLVRLTRFCEEEYEYYDGIPDSNPAKILPQDMLVTVAVNSFVTSAPKIRAVHRGLQSTCEEFLAEIPAEASILDYDEECSQLHALLHAAIQPRGILVAVATKVLHRKRPHWLPMLDSVICHFYLTAMGRTAMRSWLDDKRKAADAAVTVFRAFREDIRHAVEPLREVQTALANNGYDLSLVRIWEVLLWTEVEPQGYYRP